MTDMLLSPATEDAILKYRPSISCTAYSCIDGELYNDQHPDGVQCGTCNGAGHWPDMSPEATAGALLRYSDEEHYPDQAALRVAQARAFLNIALLAEQRATNRKLDQIAGA